MPEESKTATSALVTAEQERAAKKKRIGTAVRQLDLARKEAINDERLFGKVKEAFLNVVKAVDFNMSYLAPCIYPEALSKSGKRVPLSFFEQPFSLDMKELRIGGTAVTLGSRQIGKTTLDVTNIDTTCSLVPRYNAVSVLPRPDQLSTYAINYKRFANENIFTKAAGKKGLKINVYSREYYNNSLWRGFYALTHADNVRGPSADCLYLDEAQNFDPSLWIQVKQITSAAENPVITIGGTALDKSSFLSMMFEDSSQGTHHLRCPACGHDNDTYGETDDEIAEVLKMIRPAGLSCAHCGTKLDPASAIAVHRYPERLLDLRYGIHASKLIIPRIVNDPVKWLDIVSDLRNAPDLKKFIQEVLGIPVESSSRELTKADLMDICVLRKADIDRPDYSRKFVAVVSGCDWGGSDDQPEKRILASTTAHVMLGVTAGGASEIIHMKNYEGMGYERIIADIVENHKRYGGTWCFADAGMGAWYNAKLFTAMPGRTATIMLNGQARVAVAKVGSGSDERYSAHKTETLSSTFDAIKSKRILCYEWARAEKLLSHFLNLVRSPQELPSGQTVVVYRQAGNRLTDMAMAINFANIGKHVIMNEKMVHDGELKERYLERVATDLQKASINRQTVEKMRLRQAMPGRFGRR
jgi:thymidine kinase